MYTASKYLAFTRVIIIIIIIIIIIVIAAIIIIVIIIVLVIIVVFVETVLFCFDTFRHCKSGWFAADRELVPAF